MTVRPQAASPVTNPRTLTLSGVFSGVQSAARNRLYHTIPGLADHSRLPNTMAQGPATLPRAYVQNPQVAEVRSFQPAPGAHHLRQNVLNVQNDPGPQNDAVTRALQRYFHVQPRRQPSADPRDEASVVRHPQGIIQSGARWDQDLYYQFTDNGAASYQVRPDYRAWGGRLDMELTGAGQTTVFSPATRAPQPGATPVDQFGYYDPANAAQQSMARMTETLSRRPYVGPRVGPANMVDNPYFDSAFAGQNAVSQIRADLSRGRYSGPKAGPTNMVDDPYADSAFAGQNAVSQIRADLTPNHFPMTRVGPPNIVDNPYFDSAFAGENAVSQIRADLSRGRFSGPKVGPINMVDNPFFDSAFAGQNAVAQIQADLATGGRTPLSPIRLQADQARAQEIRDNFIRTGPTLSDWS
ncbi:MAG: hypothetical protein LBC90_03510 [Candidatus Adiutrix sp.]|jgi:hypothetical protein|nr:hypothetical protein [Candidatus Adiutrix sp.]